MLVPLRQNSIFEHFNRGIRNMIYGYMAFPPVFGPGIKYAVSFMKTCRLAYQEGKEEGARQAWLLVQEVSGTWTNCMSHTLIRCLQFQVQKEFANRCARGQDMPNPPPIPPAPPSRLGQPLKSKHDFIGLRTLGFSSNIPFQARLFPELMVLRLKTLHLHFTGPGAQYGFQNLHSAVTFIWSSLRGMVKDDCVTKPPIFVDNVVVSWDIGTHYTKDGTKPHVVGESALPENFGTDVFSVPLQGDCYRFEDKASCISPRKAPWKHLPFGPALDARCAPELMTVSPTEWPEILCATDAGGTRGIVRCNLDFSHREMFVGMSQLANRVMCHVGGSAYNYGHGIIVERLDAEVDYSVVGVD